jgi:hypothetical protein
VTSGLREKQLLARGEGADPAVLSMWRYGLYYVWYPGLFPGA